MASWLQRNRSYSLESKKSMSLTTDSLVQQNPIFTKSDNDIDIKSEIISGNLQSVEKWLLKLLCRKDLNKPVDGSKSDGKTALHYACIEKQYKIVEKLLENCADPNVTDDNKWTPLHYAAESNDLFLVEKLLAYGADLRSGRGRVNEDTPVHIASQLGHKDILDKMLQKDPSVVNVHGNNDKTPLHRAVEHGKLSTASLLIDRGTRLDAKDDSEDTPVHLAARYGHEDILKKMIEKDSNCINFQENNDKTPLHDATEHGQLSTASLLIDKGTKMDTKDDSGDTPVHYAARCGQNEILEKMIEKDSSCKHVENDKVTPLHLAAESDRASTVTLLIKRGANLKAPDDLSDTPVHWAARFGKDEVLIAMIDETPECVGYRGYNNQTPLHQACKYGHLKAVTAILDRAYISNPTKRKKYINEKCKDDETALHYAAWCGVLKIVKILHEDCDADVNPKLGKHTKTPFRKAVFYRNPEVALYLLNNGAEVKYEDFKEILSEGYEELAKAVIESDQWRLALRGTYKRGGGGKLTTAFRELIVKMPDVAKMVLDRCTERGKSKNKQEEYPVYYNYEFIEDFEDQTDNSQNKKKGESGYNKTGSGRPPEWPTSRLQRFKRKDHPLQIMVDLKRSELLTHPVVSSLIHYKWFKFGLYSYLFNLLIYALYLSLLTSFTFLVPNPQDPQCVNATMNSTDPHVSLNASMNSTETCFKILSIKGARIFLLSVAIFVLVIGRLIFEIVQLWTYREKYLKSLINWMQLAQYICTIVFIFVYWNDCLCVLSWQWEFGVAAMFFGWFVMTLFVSKLPIVGIYVLLLIKICQTFLKLIFLAALLVITFGLTLHMVFFDSMVMRSPFSDVPRSLLKTMTMTTGELDYDNIFRLDPSGGSEDSEEIKYPSVSYILWITFIVIMPLLLNNLLTSLAVGDAEAVLKESQRERLTQQVEQLLALQEFLIKCPCCQKRLHKLCRGPFPEEEKDKKTKFRRKLKHTLWGGDYYDENEVIRSVLSRQETTETQDNGTNIRRCLEDLSVMRLEMAKIDSIEKEMKTKHTQQMAKINCIEKEMKTKHTQQMAKISCVEEEMKTIRETLQQILRKFDEKDKHQLVLRPDVEITIDADQDDSTLI